MPLAKQRKRTGTHPDAAARGGLFARCGCRRKAASGGAAQPALRDAAKHRHANRNPAKRRCFDKDGTERREREVQLCAYEPVPLATSYYECTSYARRCKATPQSAVSLHALSQPCQEAAVYR